MPGEIAEMMLDGTLCSCCGELLISEGEEEAGFPMMCSSCEAEDIRATYNRANANRGARAVTKPQQCNICTKRFAGTNSLKQHMRDRHGVR